MNHNTTTIKNIKTYNHRDGYNPNGKIIEIIRNDLSCYIPQHNIFGIYLSSIHNHEKINFNCDAREILYAINACYSKKGEFRENLFGKALSIPLRYAEYPTDFSKFELYFRYYFRKRLELVESWALKQSLDISMLSKKKEEVCCNYEIVFYIDKLPMEIKQMIRSYLLCNYDTLLELRQDYEKWRREKS